MKNIHLEHPEDSILSGDLSVLDWFCEKSIISVKIDGSPAIVWGTNPVTQKFFVGTKSVFNKIKIKINHSHEEIDSNHEGQVADILHSAFDCLPRTYSIFQGDFLGFGGYDSYCPNTITYTFPEVVTQDIIVAPHTYYLTKDTLYNSEAYQDYNYWKDTTNCKFVKPTAYFYGDIEDLLQKTLFAKQVATTVTFASHQNAVDIKKKINSFIRNNQDVDESDFDCDPNLIGLWKLVQSIKNNFLLKCGTIGAPKSYINDELINQEGFVMSNKYGTYKIVDRKVFSYANFTQQKTWKNK